MIRSLLQAGAVPFGFTTSDMIDSDPGVEYITAEIILHDLHNVRGLASLPDMTRRYTPPPSPARRSPSYVFLPEKPRPQAAPAPAVASPGTPPVAPGEGQEPDPDDRAASVERSKDRRKSVSTKVEHISVLQRWFQSDYHHHPLPRHYLPRLSWSLPPRRHPPQPWGERESDLGTGEEQLQRWRHTGEDLRHVADQFQLTNAKVSRKNSSVAPPELTMPVALTRCLSACLMCLVWWRLLNKLH